MVVVEMERILLATKAMLPKYSPKEVNRDLANAWISVLKDYSDIEIKSAFGKALTSLTEFPVPVDIKRLCQGTFQDDEEIGEEIAGRIIGAIGTHGYTNPERAKAAIGELGWKVVTQFGGWTSVCETTFDQMISSRKMWRDSATILSKKLHLKGEDFPPALPEFRSPVLSSALKLVCGEGNGTY
jgi:hypothetical protein